MAADTSLVESALVDVFGTVFPLALGLGILVFGSSYMFKLFKLLMSDTPSVGPTRAVREVRAERSTPPPALVQPAPVRLARPGRYDTGCPDPDCRYCHPSPRQAIQRAANRSPLVPPPLEMWRGWDQVIGGSEVKP